MHKALVLSACTTSDRVHGNSYIGFRSHGGGRDYAGIRLGVHRSGIEGTCTVLEMTPTRGYTIERSGSDKQFLALGKQQILLIGHKGSG